MSNNDNKQPFRIGNGYDVHAFGDGDHIMLGGVAIPHKAGLKAHSDGDVLVHALCDALLGALALGDIGRHFPDTNPAFKGISSIELLRKVYGLVQQNEYSLLNADMTIIAQAPKMAPHINAMCNNIASVVNSTVDQVSVKATTTEKLGFTGREEGIAVMASVMLMLDAT